jgi:hypothetical protein
MSTTDIPQEGYSNRETWAVCLAINNAKWMLEHSKGLLQFVKDRAKQKGEEDDHLTVDEFILLWYAQALEIYITEIIEAHCESIQSVFSHQTDVDVALLINSLMGLPRVNWREVAADQLAE